MKQLAREWKDDAPELAPPPKYEVDMYFEHRGGCYFRRDEGGRYIKATIASAKRYLRSLGYSSKGDEGQLSEVDSVLEFVETHQNCDYASALAGHAAGIYVMDERRILVTESPKLIVPAPGAWDTLKTIFAGLLGDEQCRWFFAWLKCAVEAVRMTRYRRGQALIIAGPSDCGKSLCQMLITQLIGGRSASPFSFMCGRSDFNSEMFGAEHLTIEDQSASSDPRVRKKFGFEIKGLAANKVHRCHAKNREALSLSPIWRVSITLNDDPSSLLVLPQWDDGLQDKLMLFHARKFPFPVDTSVPGNQDMLERQMMRELPAFVHHLDCLTIPKEMRDTRFGVKAYHNPELLELMDATTDEMKLLEMIDAHLFGEFISEWTGTAHQLDDALSGVSGVRQLFSYTAACGTLLGHLSRKNKRVEKLALLNGIQRWRITRADASPD